jgi:Methyltransferase domain
VRALKPSVCVETGILDGLGSRTILRALARNAAEGSEGRLWSFDVMPGAGWLVPDALRDRWTPVIGDAVEALEAGTVPEAPGFYLHDSLPDPDYQRRELEWAYATGTPGAVVMTTHGWSEVLQDIAAASGGRSVTFRERPVRHFYCGRTIAVGRRR